MTYHPHPNGGGAVAYTAYVAPTAYIGPDARVSGRSRVYGTARVYDTAQVHGTAQVYDNAEVYDEARVYGNSQVYGNAHVYGSAHVFGTAQLSGNATLTHARHVMTVGPIGSENRYLTLAHNGTDDPVCTVGCWSGLLSGLLPEAQRRAPAHDREYSDAHRLCLTRLAEWETA